MRVGMEASSLGAILRTRAVEEAEREAFTFLMDAGEAERITYGELDRRARGLAERLAEAGARGERVLLLYPPGLEYVVAFFGCLYAGAVPVPAYPPRFNRTLDRLEAIVADARARFALATTALRDSVARGLEEMPSLRGLTWLSEDARNGTEVDALAARRLRDEDTAGGIVTGALAERTWTREADSEGVGAGVLTESEGPSGKAPGRVDVDRPKRLEAWGEEPAGRAGSSELVGLERRGEDLAFLQYTSGSTGSPKGVMVTHRSLLENLRLQTSVFEVDERTRVVCWLPPYHDLGLIAGILLPVYGGFPSVLMSPISFLQRPVRWLEAISHYRGTASGGPDFSYALCARRVAAEEISGLDLSSWEFALNGAEPVRAETMERFAARFGPAGFRREAFDPVYGLAEATLYVSGVARGQAPTVVAFDGAALDQGRARVASGKQAVRTLVEPEHGGAQTPEHVASGEQGGRTLVGCGRPPAGLSVRIVDPDKGVERGADEVGEVWVQGPNVAGGYWDKPEESAAVFGARLAPSGEGPFLRTGDLGFLFREQLFITGRLKDLIIVRGQNHYPQDLERTVALSHPAVRPDAGAAFSVDAEGEERLVIVQEVERQARTADPAPIVGAIRKALAEQHGVQAYAVVLIKPGTIPKTSSGKIQRHAARADYLAGRLAAVGPSGDRDEAQKTVEEPREGKRGRWWKGLFGRG